MDGLRYLLERRRQELSSGLPLPVPSHVSDAVSDDTSLVKSADLPADTTDRTGGTDGREHPPDGDSVPVDGRAADGDPAVPAAASRAGSAGPALSGGERLRDDDVPSEAGAAPPAAAPSGSPDAGERAAAVAAGPRVSGLPPPAVSVSPRCVEPAATQPAVTSAEGSHAGPVEVDTAVGRQDSRVDSGVQVQHGPVQAQDGDVQMHDCGVEVQDDNVPMQQQDCGVEVQDEEAVGDRVDTRAPLLYAGEPRLITTITTPFTADNFTKGCKWSPDGTCLLVCSEDGRLRVINLPEPLYSAAVSSAAPTESVPEPPVALRSTEGELIYDYAWFPLMRSDEPATCCYASSSRAHPVHLFDAFDGALRCTYRTYNNVDEVAAAYSVAFDPAGERLYAGLDGCLSVFDVSRPGRQIETRKMKDKRSLTAQPGIVSCIGFCAASPDIYAAGTYLRSIGLYDTADGSPLCVLQGQTGGVTHLQFSPDGTRLYSGGRKDPEILCWDLRNLGQILYSLQRNVTTNQRMYFDSDWSGRYLFSGDSDGCVQVWDTLTTPSDVGDTLVLPSIRKFGAHWDCCNGVGAHPWLPVLATSSGQRHLACLLDSSDEETETPPRRAENAVKLWWLGT